MNNKKIKVGITHGDINGVGYEVILKSFAASGMFEFCTPIIYGSAKAAAYHRKSLDISTNFSIINTPTEAEDGKLSIINCTEDDVRVEFGKEDVAAGQAAYAALEQVVEDYKKGLIDLIITAPINKHTIFSDDFKFPGHTEYLEDRLGNGNKSLMILMRNDFRMAVATGHIPISEVSKQLTKELLIDKITIFNKTLIEDFGIQKPRIAVLGLNPHAGDNGLLGKEEIDVIQPVITEMAEKGVYCFGPYSADGFMGSSSYTEFDGILAMYHDQGLIPFKVMAMDEGVNYTAGLPVIRTSPAHGTAYDIAGKGEASESSFRQAVYTAVDVFRHRRHEKTLKVNPLDKQYYNKKDDSYKLKLDVDDSDQDDL